ncbi:MAG: UDP-N-acetylglucosamine 1-carboxyvinyltransferase [Acidimicrobiia bacterium]|nr:UDP-N-acetylglucosamine 1-carboxyvinyltransferase [Acidimicrobiia bacterium]
MTRYVVRGGQRLSGTVRVAGMTKNAGLKQMAASLLAQGTTVLRNVTPVVDLDVMIDLLRGIGAAVEWAEPEVLQITVGEELEAEAPYELVSQMRASINVLGPLLARLGHARVAMPGGDNIGSRKLDMHFAALVAMGAELEVLHGFVEARCNALCGARVVLEFPSVGATETVLTTAVLAKGQTVIENAAREPEINDLCEFLTAMGARIGGAGSSTIEIEGVDELHPIDRAIVGDRIEAGTLLMACGAAGGSIAVEGVDVEHVEMVVRKLNEMGMTIETTPDGLVARADEPLRAVDVQTLPYPGFSTDFMPLAVALLTRAEGTAIVTENIFDNRFAFVDELNRMGADIRTEGRHAVVRGVERLTGAPVRAHDVRAGAALVLAALGADGETTVLDTRHVDRGYADLPSKLASLGADVSRVED